MVADWFASMALEVNPGQSSAEVEGPDTLWFPPSESSSRAAVFRNHGPFPLEVALSTDGDVSLSSDTLTVPPYSLGQVTVGWTASGPDVSVDWTTNDPDESTGSFRLKRADQGVGTVHDDFTLPGIELPGGDESTWTLSDTRGKAVVLVYWALF